MLEVQAVGLAIIALQQFVFFRHRQHMENTATIVIEDNHHQRLRGLL